MGKLRRRLIKPMFDNNKWKILRGDKVVITAGKDRGQTGVVTRVIRDVRWPRVLVEGLNLVKKHVKKTEEQPGRVVTIQAPVHYSNVQLVDPVTGGAVRVAYRFLEDGTKVRVTKGKLASNTIVPRPEILKQRRKPRPVPGVKDTAIAEAVKPTYDPAAPWHFGMRHFSTQCRDSQCQGRSNPAMLLPSLQWHSFVQHPGSAHLQPSLLGFAASGCSWHWHRRKWR